MLAGELGLIFSPIEKYDTNPIDYNPNLQVAFCSSTNPGREEYLCDWESSQHFGIVNLTKLILEKNESMVAFSNLSHQIYYTRLHPTK